jgi:hypothetical protein
MTTLNELIEKRKAETPDRHTLAWWEDQLAEVRKGYYGNTHMVNKLIAELEDKEEAIKHLEVKIGYLESHQIAAEAAIGSLQKMVAELSNSMDKCREAYRSLTIPQ